MKFSISNINNIPELISKAAPFARLSCVGSVQHIILEFLDYKLRNCRYIKQLQKDCISKIEKQLISINKFLEYEYTEEELYDEDADKHYIEQYRCIYFWISNKIYHRCSIDKYIVLKQSIYNSNNVSVFNAYFDIDFEGSMHSFEPTIPW
jgi:hypothetical protein